MRAHLKNVVKILFFNGYNFPVNHHTALSGGPADRSHRNTLISSPGESLILKHARYFFSRTDEVINHYKLLIKNQVNSGLDR